MVNEALLRALWPADQIGYRCVAWKRSDRQGMAHKWFDSTSAALQFIKAIDAADQVEAVYHACSLFDKEAVLEIQQRTGSKSKGRDQNAVAAVNALWVDIDVDPDKPAAYPSIADAAAAAKTFISQHFAPASFIVRSGGGLHLYWVLDRPVDRDEWYSMAARLKALAASVGFRADPTRTADAASILRPPGTLNRKYAPPTEVLAADRGPRYSPDHFHALLQLVDIKVVAEKIPGQLSKSGVDNSDLISPPPPSTFKGVVSRCPQIKASVATLGRDDTEPMWIAVLSTLSKCEKVTDVVLHKISSGHPDYTSADAQRKIDHARTMLPFTCERFDDANPGGCDGCQYRGKVKSPIRLGEAAFDPPAMPEGAAQPTAFLAHEFVPPIFQPYHSHQFAIHNTNGVDQLCFSVRDKDEQGNIIWTQFLPFSHVLYMPVRFERSRVDGKTEGVYRFKLPKDPDTYEKAASFDITANPNQLMLFLAKAGIAAGLGSKAVREAHIAYNKLWWAQLQSAESSTSMTDTFGWVTNAQGDNTAFVAALQYNMDGTVVEPSLSGNAAVEKNYVRMKGSLDEWKKAASIMCRPGMEPQLMVLLASTFGPFFAATGCEHGLPAICFRSQQSGTGKTTAMKLGLSVWMDPDRISTKSDSPAAKTRTLIARKDLPVLFDEMTTAEPDLIAQLAYDIPNGILRSTSSQDGKLLVPERTRTTVLMTTNTSLRGLIEQSLKGEKEAAQSRLVEIEIMTDKALEQELVSNNPFVLMRNNFGVAGDWWARYLLGAYDGTNRMGDFEGRVHAAQEKIKQQLQDPNTERFFAALAATVLVGARYVVETGFLPVDLAGFEHYIMKVLLPSHTAQRLDDAFDTLSYLAAGLHANMNSVAHVRISRPWKSNTVNNVTYRVREGRCEIHELDPPKDKLRAATVNARFERFYDTERASVIRTPRELRLIVSDAWLRKWLREQRVDYRSFIAEAKKANFLVPYKGADNLRPPVQQLTQRMSRVSMVEGYFDNGAFVPILQFDPAAHFSMHELVGEDEDTSEDSKVTNLRAAG